jgi:molybdopterin-guanine dinucleotide biosynthesis protein A
LGLITLITGERGSGKTTACQQRIAETRRAGLIAAGVVCPGRFDHGVKTGIYAEDIASSARRLLASDQPGEIAGGTPFRRWVFDPQVLAWGNEIFTHVPPCDLLVVDELGPLELVDGKGWQAALAALEEAQYAEAWVVVRPELVEIFRMRFPKAHVWVVDLDHQLSSYSSS